MMYDFTRCKLCGEKSAIPLYDLGDTVIHVCAVCDFHFIDYLDPADGTDGGDAEALGESAKSTIEEHLAADEALTSARLGLVRKYLDLKGARVLDIGAGTGRFLDLLSGEGATGAGIEPSRIRRAFARERFGIDLCCKRVEDPCWPKNFGGFFHAVTLWDVLEHVNFPSETIASASGLLKPGGLLFIDTPSRGVAAYRLSQWAHRLSGGRIHLFLGTFYSRVPFGHKQIFRPGQITALAERTGFSVEVLRREYFSKYLNPGKRIILIGRKSS